MLIFLIETQCSEQVGDMPGLHSVGHVSVSMCVFRPCVPGETGELDLISIRMCGDKDHGVWRQFEQLKDA